MYLFISLPCLSAPVFGQNSYKARYKAPGAREEKNRAAAGQSFFCLLWAVVGANDVSMGHGEIQLAADNGQQAARKLVNLRIS